MGRFLLPLAIVLLALLAFFCACHHAPRIEASLAAQAKGAIGGLGQDLEVDMHGRSAHVSGLLETELSRAGLLARITDVAGIRSVVDNLRISGTPATAPGRSTTAGTGLAGTGPPTTESTGTGSPATGSLEMRLEGDALRLRGTVANAPLRDAISGLVAERFGTERLLSELNVAETASGLTMDAATAAVESLAAGPPDGGITLANRIATIYGSFPDESARDAFVSTVRSGLPGWSLNDQSEVVAAPRAEAVEARVAEILRRGEIRFRTSSAQLTNEGVRILTDVARELRAAPTLGIAIEGHTDALGDAAMNMSLSEQRAQSVLAFLMENGVVADRMTAEGFGENRPRASNDTPAGRSANRRIEFRLREGRE